MRTQAFSTPHGPSSACLACSKSARRCWITLCSWERYIMPCRESVLVDWLWLSGIIYGSNLLLLWKLSTNWRSCEQNTLALSARQHKCFYLIKILYKSFRFCFWMQKFVGISLCGSRNFIQEQWPYSRTTERILFVQHPISTNCGVLVSFPCTAYTSSYSLNSHN